ncbi:MAG: hypothetical protein GKR87_04805 [Kiritimatiellae bacterium]|nr:hypothetical protein [Kiritimatiellia bacterium]
MRHEAYKAYLAHRYSLHVIEQCPETDEIIEGHLLSKEGHAAVVKIADGIPRFCSDDNYANNFALQWNVFRSTQLDSISGIPLTFDRFWNNTKWKPGKLLGKEVLEVGSGAGRFTEILLQAGAKVTSS